MSDRNEIHVVLRPGQQVTIRPERVRLPVTCFAVGAATPIVVPDPAPPSMAERVKLITEQMQGILNPAQYVFEYTRDPMRAPEPDTPVLPPPSDPPPPIKSRPGYLALTLDDDIAAVMGGLPILMKTTYAEFASLRTDDEDLVRPWMTLATERNMIVGAARRDLGRAEVVQRVGSYEFVLPATVDLGAVADLTDGHGFVAGIADTIGGRW